MGSLEGIFRSVRCSLPHFLPGYAAMKRPRSTKPPQDWIEARLSFEQAPARASDKFAAAVLGGLCSAYDAIELLVRSAVSTIDTSSPTTVVGATTGGREGTYVGASIALAAIPCTRAAHCSANFTAITRSSCLKKSTTSGRSRHDFAH